MVVVAFSARPPIGRPAGAAGPRRARRGGIAVEDAFRVDGSRWWSYVCHNPRAAARTGPPTTPAPRGSLPRRCCPACPSRRTAMRCGQLAPADAGIREPGGRLRDAVGDRLRATAAGRRSVRRGDRGDVGPGREPAALSAADTAWLALAVQTPRSARARAMAIVEQATTPPSTTSSGATVTSRVADDLLPAGRPVSLASRPGWRAGACSPRMPSTGFSRSRHGHPFAAAGRGVLDHGVNPRTWADIRGASATMGAVLPPAGVACAMFCVAVATDDDGTAGCGRRADDAARRWGHDGARRRAQGVHPRGPHALPGEGPHLPRRVRADAARARSSTSSGR